MYVVGMIQAHVCNMQKIHEGAVMVVILWFVEFTTTYTCMQSVPITTKVVRSNPILGEMYSILHYVIKFINYL